MSVSESVVGSSIDANMTRAALYLPHRHENGIALLTLGNEANFYLIKTGLKLNLNCIYCLDFHIMQK